MTSVNFTKLLNQVEDMLTDLFYYNRKEDDDFTLEDAEEPLTEEQKDLFAAKVRSLL